MHPIREVWWENYRKKQIRKKKLSLEMILRKSLADTAKEYGKNSSIAGVKEIFEPNINLRRRLIWTVLFSMMFGITCYFLCYIWFETLTKPLIVTMESSTYPITDIDFPAVAICNINRISQKALIEYAKELYPLIAKPNDSMADIITFALHMGRLLDYSWVENVTELRFLDQIAKLPLDTHVVLDRMNQLAPKCEEMLLKCAWGGQQMNCMDLFTVRRTVRGHCCAFNYILDYNSAAKPERIIATVKRQTGSGYVKGLNLLADPMVDDYAYPISNMIGFDIFLFDPTHFPDTSGGRVIHRIVDVNKAILLQLQSVKQIATQEVRKYPLSTRKCLFRDEKQAMFGGMYSYSACIVQCRIKTVQSLCKCTPYFLPIALEDGPICTLDELRCLNKYKEKLLYLYPQDAVKKEGLEMEIEDSLYCPECLPDCEFTQHFTKAAKIPISMATSQFKEYKAKELRTNFKYSTNFTLTNKCLISIYQSTDDGTLDRLDVISYWFEVLSNIGGFAGILLGFSIISIVEMIYFFAIRFVRILHANYKQYH